MIERSVAHPTRLTTRELRGIALYEEHAEEIRFAMDLGAWLVPSQRHGGTSVYEVRLGRRESCECRDFGRRHESCKHVYAATIARSKTRRCAGCGGRFRGRDMVEVGDDNLTFFEGDPLCRPCAGRHGVL